jgi:hypothetical protein
MIVAERQPAPALDRPAQARPAVVVVVEPLLVGSALAGKLVGVSARSWQRMHSASETPAPLRVAGKRLWSVAILRAWCAAGCPSRSRWEEISRAP